MGLRLVIGRLPRVARLAGGVLLVGGLLVVPASSASAATSPCTDGSTPALLSTVTCSTAGSYELTVPTGTTSVDVDAVGAGGGAGYPSAQHIGGNAAEVTGTATLPVGTTYLYVIVGLGGTANNGNASGGRGGGASALMAEDSGHGFLAKLAIAGGGGGGSFNGDGGDAGSPGTSNNVYVSSGPGQPGVGATGGAGGTAGSGGSAGTAGGSDSPGTLTVAAGGAGAVVGGGLPSGGGAGGYGGGGGGGGADTGLTRNVAGGGGGSSLASSALASAAVSVKAGTGGIQLPGLVAGAGQNGTVSLTFNGVAVPGAPTGVSALPGNHQATVSFTAPASDGGSPITGYTVTSSPGGLTATCSTSPCVITGLTNGTAYTFTVHATNTNGNSVESAASTAVTPAVVPGAPTGVSAVSGNSLATVSFTAPASDGGSAITGYTATSSPGGLTATCLSSPCVVGGLTNGTSYTFTVHATNSIGDSVESAPSAAVTPATTPDAPGVTLTPGDQQIAVSFPTPFDGGSAITSYQYTLDGGTTWITLPTSTTSGIVSGVITGLTNGDPYSVSARAVNAVGAGFGSKALSATPAMLPGAPTAVSATAGAGQASISFTAPVSDGGSTITSYTVTSAPGGITATCPGSPCVITGLTNGTAYTFTVHAINAIGGSVESAASTAVTPATTPDAPDVTLTPGDQQITVSFPTPFDGGSAITRYQYTTDGGGSWITLPTSTTGGIVTGVVTGLTNGTPYTVQARAVNAVGAGNASKNQDATPAMVPGAPTAVSATAGAGQATVSFTAPISDGGSAITSYTVTSAPGGITASCVGSPCVVTGLTNGTSYTFTVHATNPIGNSPESGASTAVTPLSVPGAPTGASATRGDGQASISFTPPADTGGTPITGYTVTSAPGGLTATCSQSPCTITGLTNGTSYTFTVHATNTTGDSAESTPSTAVTPATAPSPPTAVSATAEPGGASITFTAPINDGGSAITGYTVTSAPGGITATCTSSPCVITGLTNGTTYLFTVTATNTAGTSPASVPTLPVTPVGAPDAPVVTTTPGNSQVTVTFPAPAEQGSPITGYEYSVDNGTTWTTLSTTDTNGTLTGTITGLTNGTTYPVQVRAVNVIGTGTASTPTPVTPITTPNAPSNVAATAHTGSATVSFTAPAADGGSAITSYTVTSAPGGITATCTTSPCTITGLTNGTAYTFTVQATNNAGDSPESASSNRVTPHAPPAPITGITATTTPTTITVTFTAPDDNGSPITSYQISADNGKTWHAFTVTSTTGGRLAGTLTGLTPGTTYPVTVRAITADAAGSPSASITARTPLAPLTAPTAVPGTSSATLTWTPSPTPTVTGYTVYAHPGTATCTTTGIDATTCLIGATAGIPYTYTVIAHSPAGDTPTSAPSDAVTATPPLVPATAPLDASTTLTTTDGILTTVTPGQQITFLGTGFLPLSSVSLILFSTPVVLAAPVTDANGDFRQPVTLPSTITPGLHNFLASGVDPSGKVRYLRMDVTVPALATTTVITPTPTPTPTTVTTPTGTLSYTGTPTTQLLLWAFLLTGTGLLLLRRARRHHPRHR